MALRQSVTALLVLRPTAEPASIQENDVIPHRPNFCAEISCSECPPIITLRAPLSVSRQLKKCASAHTGDFLRQVIRFVSSLFGMARVLPIAAGALPRINRATHRGIGTRADANAFRVVARFSFNSVVIVIASLLTYGQFHYFMVQCNISGESRVLIRLFLTIWPALLNSVKQLHNEFLEP